MNLVRHIGIALGVHALLTVGARDQIALLLIERSIGFAAEGAAEAFVALLVAAVADGVVVVPTGRQARPGRPRPAVAAHAAILSVCVGGGRGGGEEKRKVRERGGKRERRKKRGKGKEVGITEPLRNCDHGLEQSKAEKTTSHLHLRLTLHFQPFLGMVVMTGLRQKVW